MSRPKPNIIQSTRDDKSNQWDIIEGTALYIVLYDTKPVNIRQHVETQNYSGYKYQKVSYTNLAIANNSATRFNKLFNTALFTVKRIA